MKFYEELREGGLTMGNIRLRGIHLTAHWLIVSIKI